MFLLAAFTSLFFFLKHKLYFFYEYYWIVSVLACKHAPVAQEFLKKGAPRCLRGKLWAQVMGSEVRDMVCGFDYTSGFNTVMLFVFVLFSNKSFN